MTDISTCLNRALQVVSFFFSPLVPIPLSKVGETIRHERMPQSRCINGHMAFRLVQPDSSTAHART